jgi:hypothetical protein
MQTLLDSDRVIERNGGIVTSSSSDRGNRQVVAIDDDLLAFSI